VWAETGVTDDLFTTFVSLTNLTATRAAGISLLAAADGCVFSKLDPHVWSGREPEVGLSATTGWRDTFIGVAQRPRAASPSRACAHKGWCWRNVRSWGEVDIDRESKPTGSVANDPNATFKLSADVAPLARHCLENAVFQRSRDDPCQCEARCVEKVLEFDFGTLPASGTDQHRQVGIGHGSVD
jgi:hypothetical protein